MRKITLVTSLALILFFTGAISFGAPVSDEETKYADAKKVLENLAGLLETFVENMDKADNPKSIAKALDGFALAMKDLLPEINEIRQKYPELDKEDTHPEELKPLLQRIDKDFQAMMKSYGKVMEHIEDPAVRAADDKFKEVMDGLS
ncbi:MAG: hypothetical protein PVH84_00960 [Candidatus Aminicenantes bacterium]|jgi:hypothetical protein